jgi:hypothetical protein
MWYESAESIEDKKEVKIAAAQVRAGDFRKLNSDYGMSSMNPLPVREKRPEVV